MTREEAKQWIKDLISTMKLETSGSFPDAPYEDEVYEALEMAIKALEKEPCEDAISRQSMLDYIKYLHGEMPEEEFVKALPSVTPTRKKEEWIPVSERLPNDRDWYLGIFKEPDTGWINPLPFICNYVGSETKATTKEHWILRGFTDRDERIDYCFNLECVAWMPLPEPYKAEMEGEEESK